MGVTAQQEVAGTVSRGGSLGEAGWWGAGGSWSAEGADGGEWREGPRKSWVGQSYTQLPGASQCQVEHLGGAAVRGPPPSP